MRLGIIVSNSLVCVLSAVEIDTIHHEGLGLTSCLCSECHMRRSQKDTTTDKTSHSRIGYPSCSTRTHQKRCSQEKTSGPRGSHFTDRFTLCQRMFVHTRWIRLLHQILEPKLILCVGIPQAPEIRFTLPKW